MRLLSIDTIAKVVVNVTRTSASSVVFDTGLILTSCTNFTEAKRLMTFASSTTALAALQNAGFTAQDDVYKATIQDLNGNVYVTRGYTHHVFEKGTMASGIRFDDQLYLDLIADELQNEAVNMIAGSETKLPQTDDTTTQFMNRFSAILMRFAQRQILATGVWRGNAVGPLETGDILENGFAMWADSYDTQSDADRAARKAMPINVALNMAGAVESIVISVNVVI